MLCVEVIILKNRIKTFREMKGITQTTLAELLSISQKKMSNIENGLVEPSLSEISKLTQVFNRKFEELFVNDEEEVKMSKGVLIQYRKMDSGHVDPNFTHLTYGDSGKKATRLKNLNLEKGWYAFFHTSIGGAEYITGYFEIEEVLYKGIDDANLSNLTNKGHAIDNNDEIVLVGNRDTSKILSLPLLFDTNLGIELTSLGITKSEFSQSTQSELGYISSKTREHRELSKFDTDLLIRKCTARG